jgi:Domain of unknown function (DUF5666)
MKPSFLAPRLPMRRHAAVWLASLAVLAACGGGGGADDGNATPAGAVAYTQGVITGFGSIIVNGVRFDDSSASYSDDNGGNRDRSEMRLGMRVEVDSSSIDSTSRSATARAVRVGSELVGPVSAPPANGSLSLLGQTVVVSASTVFDDSLAGGLAAITTGRVLEVHAVYDAATGQYRATRIEPESSVTFYKLRGPVSALDTAAKTFQIGGAKINYAGVAAANLPSNLANGQTLRVLLQTAQVNGEWVASSLRSGVRKVDDNSHAHLRGTITSWTSATQFSVNGQAVDASRAVFDDGRDGVVLGAAVEVEGTVSNGVLVASKVELESRHSNDDDHGTELHGQISSLNAAAKTFVLRGVTVSYAGSVSYDRGSAANLAANVKVEVRGALASDGVTLNATRIKFED